MTLDCSASLPFMLSLHSGPLAHPRTHGDYASRILFPLSPFFSISLSFLASLSRCPFVFPCPPPIFFFLSSLPSLPFPFLTFPPSSTSFPSQQTNNGVCGERKVDSKKKKIKQPDRGVQKKKNNVLVIRTLGSEIRKISFLCTLALCDPAVGLGVNSFFHFLLIVAGRLCSFCIPLSCLSSHLPANKDFSSPPLLPGPFAQNQDGSHDPVWIPGSFGPHNQDSTPVK